MLVFFKQLSLSRGAWILTLVIALGLEGVALFFQHIEHMAPCVMCIYERVAVFGIALGALVGIVGSKFFITRFLALIIATYSAIRGLLLTIQHVDYQLHPAPWNQCSVNPNFPSSLPLDQWLPSVFRPYGSCSEINWTFLNLSMPQWLMIIFSIFSVVFILAIISQISKVEANKRNRSLFK